MRTLRSTCRRVRRALRHAVGHDIQFPVQVNVAAERHGSDYGGWWICPLGIDSDSVVYSLGIGTDITFDLSLIAAYGVTVHAFDPTPGSIAYVEGQPLPSRYKWQALGVAADDGRASFFPPANSQHISHSLSHRSATGDRAIQVEVRRLSTIMQSLAHRTIDVLKMDIEGAEYEVLDEILQSALPVQQILVEFHHRFPEIGIERTRRAVDQLNAAGYRIFFASESGEEYSFVLCSESGVPRFRSRPALTSTGQ
jgi:FkbM family methyltransferase